MFYTLCVCVCVMLWAMLPEIKAMMMMVMMMIDVNKYNYKSVVFLADAAIGLIYVDVGGISSRRG